MLNQLSWQAYTTGILSITAGYYLIIFTTCYRVELKLLFYRLSGKKPEAAGDVPGSYRISEYTIMGAAEHSEVAFVSQEELAFAAPELPDETGEETLINREFEAMFSEVKTLAQVITGSGESRENFDMLFELIIQKFPLVRGASYRDRINNFLIAESEHFPFLLTQAELNSAWSII